MCMYRTRRVTEHAIHDTAVHLDAGIFLADLRNSFGVSAASADAAPKLTTVANFQSAVPGAPSGVTFTGFSNPSVSDALVAFVGSTSAGELGVYAYDIATGELALVADTLAGECCRPAGEHRLVIERHRDLLTEQQVPVIAVHVPGAHRDGDRL